MQTHAKEDCLIVGELPFGVVFSAICRLLMPNLACTLLIDRNPPHGETILPVSVNLFFVSVRLLLGIVETTMDRICQHRLQAPSVVVVASATSLENWRTLCPNALLLRAPCPVTTACPSSSPWCLFSACKLINPRSGMVASKLFGSISHSKRITLYKGELCAIFDCLSCLCVLVRPCNLGSRQAR